MNRHQRPRAHHPPQLRLRRGTRAVLYGLGTALFASGALWLYLRGTRAPDALPGALEPWLLKLHGAAAMLLLYVTGTMLYGHMVNAWHQRRNRLAGTVTAAAFVLLASTGYGLYYFDGEALRRATEWAHWICGFGLPLVLWWHVSRGRASQVAAVFTRAAPVRHHGVLAVRALAPVDSGPADDPPVAAQVGRRRPGEPQPQRASARRPLPDP